MTIGNFLPPPITSSTLSLIEQIGEALGVLSRNASLQKDLRLRRISTARSVQASLQIEGNTLSLGQVTALLEGKLVLAAPREIQEIKNAIEAYESIGRWDPWSRDDLLEAHKILMKGLIDDPGRYRSGSAGIKRGEKLLHIAPPAEMVTPLMNELFTFITALDLHPLITSSVFHYEFEYIHPFSDGNGRLGRLWQTLILYKWKPIFAVIPIESVIRDHQEEYYAALNRSNKEVHPGSFVEFILRIILVTLQEFETPVTPPVTPPVKELLKLLAGSGPLGNQDILSKLRLKDRRRLRESYITPALKAGLIEYTIPEKPTSRNQMYRITYSGMDYLKNHTPT